MRKENYLVEVDENIDCRREDQSGVTCRDYISDYILQHLITYLTTFLLAPGRLVFQRSVHNQLAGLEKH